MRNYFSQLIWLSCYLIMFLPQTLIAQEPLKTQTMEQEFAQAMELLNAFQNDDANNMFAALIKELEAVGELDTHFGLQVRLRQAESLEKDHQNEEAIQKLLVIADKSSTEEYWDVFANAQLSLARLQEKLDRAESCWNYLISAEQHIKQHQLDSIYPRFYNRIASYYRIFSSKDSALYHAQNAINTATQLGQEEEEAVGHLIAGLVWRDSIPNRAIEHFKFAGERWKRVGDYSGYGAILTNLSRIYLRKQMPELALQYSDSALVAFNLAAFNGSANRHVFYWSYKYRAKIFTDLGQLDSTLYYSTKGYEIELEEARAANNDKIIEIEERYKDKQKAIQIDEQKTIIAYQKSRKNTVIWLCFISLTFAAILAYYYLKLRKANKKTIEQAKIISTTNEELSVSLKQQMLLHGEVHHRVKNNLQIIISLLELQSEDLEDTKAIKSLEAMSNRIYSMAAIHEMLYQKQGTELINLLEYTQNLCQHFNDFLEQKRPPVFHIHMDDRYFNLATLMPLGIILNELLTNSIKYASNIEKQLQISISLQTKLDKYQLIYKDNGPGFPEGGLDERKGGLGTYLLNSMSRQLNGEIVSYNENGAVYKIFFKEKNSVK